MSIKRVLKGNVYLRVQRMINHGKFWGKKRLDKEKAWQNKWPLWKGYEGRIYSEKTHQSYYPTMQRFVAWCADRYGLRHEMQITASMMKVWIREQMGRLKASTPPTA